MLAENAKWNDMVSVDAAQDQLVSRNAMMQCNLFTEKGKEQNCSL